MRSKLGDLAKINHIARVVRQELENKYGCDNNCLMGKCIEATDKLVEMYRKAGFKSEAKQVWVLYENFETCSNYCYEEHWLAIVYKGNTKMYIDVTMSQFQWAFSKELNRIFIGFKLPNFYLTRKPGKTTLDKCGWNDWYNYGNYINNFNYYGGNWNEV